MDFTSPSLGKNDMLQKIFFYAKMRVKLMGSELCLLFTAMIKKGKNCKNRVLQMLFFGLNDYKHLKVHT